MRFVRRMLAGSFVVVLVLGLLPAGPAKGAVTFRVTRFTDPAPGACFVDDCSLREAVIAANGTVGADIIEAPAGIYSLNISGAIGTSAGDLDITDDVEVKKVGGGPVAMVDGSGALTQDRVWEISNGADVIFRNIGARDGVAPVPPGAADTDPRFGGGIRVNPGASLMMFGGNVTDNHAPNTASVGGGIWVGGQLNLSRVVLQINETDFGFGGGIWTEAGGLTFVDKSVVRDNTSGFGGGFAGQGLTVVTESLVRGNDAGLGGAFYVAGGTFTVASSTITDNVTPDRGGAVRARNGSITFLNSTISENVAGVDGGAISAQDDAGAPPTSVSLTNTILGDNVDQDNAGSTGHKPDCYDQTGGLFSSSGGNIVRDATGCSIIPTTGDQIGSAGAPVDPGLFSLAFNGGPLPSSLTYALRPTSPALDNGVGVCEPRDQRGVPRNRDNPCDTGAYARVLCNGVLVNRVGTAGDDSFRTPALKPTGGADGYLGLQGNDNLRGGGGNDALCGVEGNDRLFGLTGSDIISGGPGNDHEEGGPGNDDLFGGPGNDDLEGGIGTDSCDGGPGQDQATSCENQTGIP